MSETTPVTPARVPIRPDLFVEREGQAPRLVGSRDRVTGQVFFPAEVMNPVTMTEGTLIIERGEVVKRMNNVLMIRNERGRMLRVVVPTDFKFSIDGREMSVTDLKEGTKLTIVNRSRRSWA